MAKKSGNGHKKNNVLDLNTEILMGIHDELRALNSSVDGHTRILQEHTTILLDHSKRIEGVENAVKELARKTRRWVAHFDRDYMRLANEFDGIRTRAEAVEQKVSAHP